MENEMTNVLENEFFRQTPLQKSATFAFGPFRVRGNILNTAEIDENSAFYKLGFRKLKTIVNTRSGSALAVILRHENPIGSDAAILYPDKFPSWNWDTVVHRYLVIITDGTFYDDEDDAGNAFITDKTIEAHSNEFWEAMVHKSSNHVLYIKRISYSPKDFSQEDGVSLLMKAYTGRIEDRPTVAPDDSVHYAGKMTRRVQSDTDTCLGLEQITLAIFDEFGSETISFYDVVNAGMNKYIVEFDKKIGFYYPLDLISKNFQQASIFKSIGFGKEDSKISPKIIEVMNQFILEVGLPKHIDRVELSYNNIIPPLKTAGIAMIDPSIDVRKNAELPIATLGFSFVPFQVDCVNSSTKIGAITTTLQSYGIFIAIPAASDIGGCTSMATSLYKSINKHLKFYFVTVHKVSSAKTQKSWHRTILKVMWMIEIVPRSRTPELRISGMVIKDVDKIWIAKFPETTMSPVPYCTGTSIFNRYDSKWEFNTEYLAEEKRSKRDPQGYIRNFKDMMKTLGIGTPSITESFPDPVSN